MNKFRLVVVLTGMLSSLLVFAGDAATNEWGSASCGVALSLKLKDTAEQIRTNRSVNVTVRIRNVSTNVIKQFNAGLTVPVSFTVVFPSGKETSTDFPVSQMGSTTRFLLQTNEIRELNYNLSSMFKMSETGNYQVTAKFLIAGSCVAVSNPLQFQTMVPLTNVVYNPKRRIGF